MKKPKEVLDKLNALKSKLSSLKGNKLSKRIDEERIKALEEEIDQLSNLIK